jgi:hypothetical protein
MGASGGSEADLDLTRFDTISPWFKLVERKFASLTLKVTDFWIFKG